MLGGFPTWTTACACLPARVCVIVVCVCVCVWGSPAEARPYGNTAEAFCTSSHLLVSPLLILPQGGSGEMARGWRGKYEGTSKEL